MRAAGFFCVLAVCAAGHSLRAPESRCEPSATLGHDLSLDARLDGLLTDLLGPGRARAFVRAARIAPDEAEPPSSLWSRMRHAPREPALLPGYPLPLELREAALRALRGQKEASSRELILEVTLLVNTAVPEGNAQAAAKLVSSVLGLDPSRGDSLRVLRGQFAAPAPKKPAERWPAGRDLLAPAAALAALLGALVIAVLAAALRPRFLRLRRPAPERPTSPGSAASEEDALLLRAGISRRHAPAVSELLAAEGPASAARALGMLEPGVAADVFRRLSGPLRRDTAAAILSLPPPRASSLAQRLESRAAAYDLGYGLLEEILLRCPAEVRESVLCALEPERPAEARRLRESLPTLEAVAAADRESLSACLRPLSQGELALFLYEAPEALVEAALACLPDFLREDARERARRLVPSTLQAVAEVRARVFARWRRLSELGRVRPLCARN